MPPAGEEEAGEGGDTDGVEEGGVGKQEGVGDGGRGKPAIDKRRSTTGERTAARQRLFRV